MFHRVVSPLKSNSFFLFGPRGTGKTTFIKGFLSPYEAEYIDLLNIAHITTMKGALSSEQKTELHRRFADLMVEIEGKGNEELRKYIILSISEEEPENISVGGLAADAEFVRNMVHFSPILL